MLEHVIFVSAQFPSDLRLATNGIYQRMRILLEAAQKSAKRLEIAFFVDPKMDISADVCEFVAKALRENWLIDARVQLFNKAPVGDDSDWWSHYVRPAFSIFKQPLFAPQAGPEQIRFLQSLIDQRPSAIIAHRLYTMAPFTRITRAGIPVYFDLDDVEHLKFLRKLAQPPWWPGKLAYYLQYPALRHGEKSAARAATATLVCSEIDRELLALKGYPKVTVVQNAVDIADEQEQASGPTLLVVGSYRYLPNVTGANWLIEQVWPHIRRSLPAAQLTVAGDRPERIPAFDKAPDGVNFVGFVDDLAALYADSSVVCCPILYGSGTRIKILEAAAFGKAIVSTSVGAEGIDLTHQHSIYVCDSATSFAAACVNLMEDRNKREEIGKNAREYVIKNNERTRVISDLSALFAETRAAVA